MQPIDPHALSTVTGGFGALLGGLAKAAGPILNGVAGIIGAAKSGGGGGSSGGGGAALPGTTGQPGELSNAGGGDPQVSVSVSINGQPVR